MKGDSPSNPEHEETVATIATAVNSLKSQTVSMANKYRRKWRGRDKSSGYSLRGTPQRDSLEMEDSFPVSKLAQVAQKEGEHEDSSSVKEGKGGEPSAGAGEEIRTDSQTELAAVTDPALVEVVERCLRQYSEQLVAVVKQKTHQT